MNRETKLMNEIAVALSEFCKVHRINVGTFKTKDGRVVKSGVAPGFSDLFGHRKSDGRAFYIEVKTKTGRATKKQTKFLAAMERSGAITGIARSVAEAVEIVGGNHEA